MTRSGRLRGGWGRGVKGDLSHLTPPRPQRSESCPLPVGGGRGAEDGDTAPNKVPDNPDVISAEGKEQGSP